VEQLQPCENPRADFAIDLAEATSESEAIFVAVRTRGSCSPFKSGTRTRSILPISPPSTALANVVTAVTRPVLKLQKSHLQKVAFLCLPIKCVGKKLPGQASNGLVMSFEVVRELSETGVILGSVLSRQA
jgi:hypothetical protein